MIGGSGGGGGGGLGGGLGGGDGLGGGGLCENGAAYTSTWHSESETAALPDSAMSTSTRAGTPLQLYVTGLDVGASSEPPMHTAWRCIASSMLSPSKR